MWEFKGQERKLKQLVSGSGLCIRDKPLPGVGESATEAQVGLHCPFRLRLRVRLRVRPPFLICGFSCGIWGGEVRDVWLRARHASISSW